MGHRRHMESQALRFWEAALAIDQAIVCLTQASASLRMAAQAATGLSSTAQPLAPTPSTRDTPVPTHSTPTTQVVYVPKPVYRTGGGWDTTTDEDSDEEAGKFKPIKRTTSGVSSASTSSGGSSAPEPGEVKLIKHGHAEVGSKTKPFYISSDSDWSGVPRGHQTSLPPPTGIKVDRIKPAPSLRGLRGSQAGSHANPICIVSD